MENLILRDKLHNEIANSRKMIDILYNSIYNLEDNARRGLITVDDAKNYYSKWTKSIDNHFIYIEICTAQIINLIS